MEGRGGDALQHLKFACGLCMQQSNAGRCFVFEHPSNARSWQQAYLVNVQAMGHAWKLIIHHCAYGLTATTGDRRTLAVLKPTTIMTGCPGMSMTLSKTCTCKGPHQTLEGRDPNTHARAENIKDTRIPHTIVQGIGPRKTTTKKNGHMVE